MQWIGINQNRANRFIEQFIRNGDLNTMLNKGMYYDGKSTISLLDYLLESTY
jgi:sugar fermentation stimulation protein A